METAVCLSGFLLLVFITGIHTDLYYVFGPEGGRAEIAPFWNISFLDYSVLYRIYSNRNLLLINCSQPEKSPPEGYNVECVHGTTFVMNNLTMSHSGDYRAVKWRDNNTVQETNVHLTVCAECEEPSLEVVTYDDDVALCKRDPTLQGSSLQLYQHEHFKGNILVLDTNSSLVWDLRGRLQVDLNNSQEVKTCTRGKQLVITQWETNAAYFDGSGYAEITFKGDGSMQRFSMDMRLLSYNGILLLLQNEGKFICLAVRNGNLELYSDFQGNQAEPSKAKPAGTAYKVSNAEPVTIEVIIIHRSKRIIVRGEKTTVYSAQFDTELPTFTGVYYLGGVAENVMPESLKSLFPKQTGSLGEQRSGSLGSIQGCIKNIKAMGSHVDLRRMKSTGLSYGCPTDLLVRAYTHAHTDARTHTRNSQVRLCGFMDYDSTDLYCVTWSGTQCQSYSQRTLKIISKKVFAHEEENVTLYCIGKGESPSAMRWFTPNGEVRLSSNQSDQYMLNGSQTGDYSLIIPSVSLQHSGGYECKGRYLIKVIIFYVCTKVSHIEVMFSHGESVILEHSADLNGSWSVEGVQWYRQKVLQPQVLILDFNRDYNKSVFMPEDLRDRVTVSSLHLKYSLTISNLTAENSGVYTWRVYGRDTKKYNVRVCYEGEIHLVYRDPFGVPSPFYRVYASLMGCALLGLVTAVIWFNPRSRRGEQTSGRQSREGQQSGDEDDEVEMAELST